MPTARTSARTKSATDDRLLATALEHFGQRGLDGASTRDIARAAGTVMSSITYHYGSKQGLYLATARYVARQMAAHLDPAIDAAAPAETLDRAGAVEAVANAVDVVVRFMLQSESAPLARFILRKPPYERGTIGLAGSLLLLRRVREASAYRLQALVLLVAALVPFVCQLVHRALATARPWRWLLVCLQAPNGRPQEALSASHQVAPPRARVAAWMWRRRRLEVALAQAVAVCRCRLVPQHRACLAPLVFALVLQAVARLVASRWQLGHRHLVQVATLC